MVIATITLAPGQPMPLPLDAMFPSRHVIPALGFDETRRVLSRHGLEMNASVVPLNFSIPIKPLLRSITQYRFQRGVKGTGNAISFADFEELLAGGASEGGHGHAASSAPRFARM